MKLDILFQQAPLPAFRSRRLDEMGYMERSPLMDVFRANRGRWIHFSQIPKLGINPKKSHDDPIGIYFYPVDFLLTDFHRMVDGSQFGLSWPYYFLCDLDLSAPGLTLSTTSSADVNALAARNGWKPLLDAYEAAPEAERASMVTYHARKASLSPGAFLWAFLDQQQKEKRISWNRALKGLSYVRDDGNSIIHSYEPDQIVVFDPRIIRNASLHENKTGDALQAHKTDKKEAWVFALKKIFEGVSAEVGGKLVWKDKMPELHAEVDHCSFRFYFSAFSQSIYCEFKHGRAKDSKSTKIRDRKVAEIVQELVGWVNEVVGRDNDLTWDPPMSEEDGRYQISYGVMASPRDLVFDTEINNTYSKSVSVTADYVSKRTKRAVIDTRVAMFIREETVEETVSCRVNDTSVVSFKYIPVDPQDSFGALHTLCDEFEQALRSRSQFMGPDSDSWRRRSFRYRDDWAAFLGWFVENCGVSFNGLLQERFADEIAAYHDYAEKRHLMDEIQQIMSDHR